MTLHSDRKQSILIVDDAPENFQIFSDILYPRGMNIFLAQSGAEALTVIARDRPDLILLDIIMPGMNGFEVCRRVKQNPATQDIPVIFLTARTETGDIVRGFDCGAVDYIMKPFHAGELLSRILTHLKLKRARELQASQRLVAKKALEEREVLHQLILSNISGAVFLTDDEGRFRYVCDNVTYIFGFSVSEVQALDSVDRLLPGIQEYHHALEKQAEIRNIEYRVVGKQGEEHVLLIDLKRVAIKNGTILYTCHDVGRRKQMEVALQRSGQQYRILAENVADGIGIIQDGGFVFVNEALSRIFGQSSQQLLALNPLDLFHQDSRKDFRKLLDQTATGTFERTLEMLCLTRDGREVWVEERHSTIEWEARPALTITMWDITARKFRELAIEQEKEQLQRSNIVLRGSLKDRYRLGDIIGKSPAMQEIYELILKAAFSNVNVVISGESGSGKELVAWTIHTLSERRKKSFTPVNCGAIPENLFESEFFGHRKGAFTGAYKDKQGFFDHAGGGTLFLDEIGELPLPMQVKLLRVLAGDGFIPLGDHLVRKPDARVLAATNQNLKELVEEGRIREDFYYRVTVVQIDLPPLRERREDIPPLIDHFLRQFRDDSQPLILPGKVLQALYDYDWPGNVRELQNALQRYLTTKQLDFIAPRRTKDTHAHLKESLPDELGGMNFHEASRAFEKQFVLRALERERWNRSKTAVLLGISRRSLFRQMQKHGL